jgi:hypothetical protein
MVKQKNVRPINIAVSAWCRTKTMKYPGKGIS